MPPSRHSLRLPTQINHRVDRNCSPPSTFRAADNHTAPFKPACGTVCIAQLRCGAFGHGRKTCRALHQWRGIRASGLQDTHLVLTIFTQPTGQHAARRARTNYDIVKYFIHATRSRSLKAPTLRALLQNLDTIFPAYQSLT